MKKIISTTDCDTSEKSNTKDDTANQIYAAGQIVDS